MAFNPVASMDHGSVTAACSTCHLTGAQLGSAPLKPTTGSHTGTTDTCDDCHNTVAFNPVALMDHGSVTAACSTCHLTGAQLGSAPIKPTTGPHTGTTNTCDDCHNTIAFIPVTSMDHGSVTATCSTCHLTGAQLDAAPVKPTSGDHLNTTDNCTSCHNTVAFAPVAMIDHTETTGTCSGCHAVAGTFGAPQRTTTQHGFVTDSCEDCHQTTSFFFPTTCMDHTQLTTGTCSNCHGAAINDWGAPASTAGTQPICP